MAFLVLSLYCHVVSFELRVESRPHQLPVFLRAPGVQSGRSPPRGVLAVTGSMTRSLIAMVTIQALAQCQSPRRAGGRRGRQGYRVWGRSPLLSRGRVAFASCGFSPVPPHPACSSCHGDRERPGTRVLTVVLRVQRLGSSRFGGRCASQPRVPA